MLRDVLLDVLDQHVGHVLALGGGGGLEGVVQIDFDVQIHALHLGFVRFQWTHLLSRRDSEVRISGYEYLDQSQLVLLCYKCGAPQKGQLWSCRRRTREIVCLSVAIEPGLCRSGRTRRSPRTELGRHFGDG